MTTTDNGWRRRVTMIFVRTLVAQLAVLATLVTVPTIHAAPGDHRWSAGFAAGGQCSVDGTGHVAGAGTFFGPIDFGGGVLTPGNGLSGDVYLARFDGDGNHVWSFQFTPTGFGPTVDVLATDAAGNIYVGGMIQNGSIDFGGGAISGTGELYVAAFNSAGGHLWSFTVGAGTFRGAASNGSNVIFTGYTYTTVDFGGGAITSAGDSDIFIASLTGAGGHAWSAGFGGAMDQGGMAVAVDGSGNVVLGSTTEEPINFGGGTLTPNGVDMCLVQFDDTGAHQWSQIFDGVFSSGSGILADMAIDISSGGDIAVAGQMGGSVDFGGGALASNGSGDMYVAVFNSAGAHQWSLNYGGTVTDRALGVAFDPSGNVMVCGLFLSANTSFGGNMYSPGGMGSDFFAAIYDAGGAHVWSNSFGQNGQWSVRAGCDPSGHFFLSGGAAGGIDFGGGPLANAEVFLVELEGDSPASAVATSPPPGELRQNVPNPFNPSTTIPFTTLAAGHVTLRVFDVSGRLVRTLVDGQRDAGPHDARWDGRDHAGRAVASGVYFYRLTTRRFSQTRRMVLLK